MTLEEGRSAIRLTTTELDGEIQADMNAVPVDLKNAGMAGVPDEALLDTAVRLYLRWQFNFCGRGEEYERAYKELKNSLALAYAEPSAGGATSV